MEVPHKNVFKPLDGVELYFGEIDAIKTDKVVILDHLFGTGCEFVDDGDKKVCRVDIAPEELEGDLKVYHSQVNKFIVESLNNGHSVFICGKYISWVIYVVFWYLKKSCKYSDTIAYQIIRTCNPAQKYWVDLSTNI